MIVRVKDYLRVINLVWHSSQRYSLLVLVTTIASSIMLPAQMWISKVILDNLFANFQQTGVQSTVDWVEILTPVAIFFLIWLLGVISQSSAQNFKELLTIQVDNRVRFLLLNKASSLSISFFETPAFFDKMNNAMREVYRVQNATAMLLETFRFGISLIVTLILLSRVALWVPLVLLIATLPQVAIQSHYIKQRYRLYLSRSTSERKIYYFSWLLTAPEVVKEIRLFQLQNHFLDQFRQSTAEFFLQLRKIVLAEERTNVVLGVLATLGTLLVWVYSILQAVLKRITVGDLALTFQAAELSRNTLSEVFQWSALAFENSLYIRNLFEFLDLPPDAVAGALTQKATPGRISEKPLLSQAKIEFQNVSFRYPGSEKLALGNLSFVLHPGERVALVGENGAGKTTMVKLLARLYDPTEGVILYGGKDLREFEPEAYYRLFGIIFQDFVRYSLSVHENIGVGQLENLGDRQYVTQAAYKGGALEMIERLPKGFDTVLGKGFEEGVDLSVGEWQKIALSRAFMRESPILILDEPTSSLDALAEYDIYNRFAELTAGKTTIFISHRLSSCKMADRILFFKEGRLIEEGTHVDLLAKKGEYFNMFNIQAERYR